jgi:hypothetical protein
MSTKLKPSTLAQEGVMPESNVDAHGRIMPAYMQHEAGIQISLRIPRAELAKLTKLADAAVQTKSQFVTRLLQRIPDQWFKRTAEELPDSVLKKVYAKSSS